MALPSNALILDAPSGFGRNSLALADRGYDVVAVDKDMGRLGSLENSKTGSLRPGSIHSVRVDLTNRLPFNDLTYRDRMYSLSGPNSPRRIPPHPAKRRRALYRDIWRTRRKLSSIAEGR